MEVHAHTHTERKRFKHYLFEFFMLFLAVFCGFLAENFREHQVDRQRGQKYIESMITDLKKDTTDFPQIIDYNIKKVGGMDSLATLLDKPMLTEEDEKQLYVLNKNYASSISPMIWNDGTYHQLLTSGNFRLISKRTTDSIMNYYGQPKDNALGQESILEDATKRAYFFSEKIFDRSYPNFTITKDGNISKEPFPDKIHLLTKEKKELKEYSQMVRTAMGVTAQYISNLIDMNKLSKNLLIFLTNEYH
ncbi:MAG: hypothetical protein JST10_04870 [Bacteroidetes bacterium]|nr:hypothetical protein [Bacteroidota bacterium]MBS1631886.1 hypothetical protein [Bacteroidota bacterium]